MTLALDGSEWSASCLCRFTPGTHSIGRWVGPTFGLDAVEKKTIAPAGSRVVQPVARHYSDWAVPAGFS
jgi:hypothetical protein